MEGGLRVACRLNEVETGMDTIVNNLQAVDTVLLLEVGVETRFNVIENGLPAGHVNSVRSC
jgi:hypothetical protein